MKAMVLSAGYGTRMGDLTREIPKPMLDLNGRPILEWILANLARHGFNEIAINLHFHPEMIRGHFGDGSRLGVKIVYSEEPQLLGTAGGVKKMEPFLRSGDAFLVHYGDVVTDQDFSAMLRFHRAKNALATLLLHERAKSNSVITLDSENRIIGFLERPTDDARRGVTSTWVNSGVCLCHPDIFDSIPPHTPCDLPSDIFPKLLATRRIFGFPLCGQRVAIDSPDRLALARSLFSSGK
jgi:NDP-sugar pyrophosphorylase family protein